MCTSWSGDMRTICWFPDCPMPARNSQSSPAIVGAHCGDGHVVRFSCNPSRAPNARQPFPGVQRDPELRSPGCGEEVGGGIALQLGTGRGAQRALGCPRPNLRDRFQEGSERVRRAGWSKGWYRLEMGFQPDIIVTDRDGSDLEMVVKATTAIPDFGIAEGQLKKYMASMKCSVGMLVSPERLWLYEDRYLDSSDSITLVDSFDVSKVPDFARFRSERNSASLFEEKVQSWLEGLRTEAGLRELPPELRKAVRVYVDPAILNGSIRAAGPRSFQNA
jgi:hypothetical protein